MRITRQAKPIRVSAVFLLIVGFAQVTRAKSLYVITDRLSTVAAFKIDGYEIEYLTEVEDLPHNGNGAVGRQQGHQRRMAIKHCE